MPEQLPSQAAPGDWGSPMGLLPIGLSQVLQRRGMQAPYRENCVLNGSIRPSSPPFSAGVTDFILPDRAAVRSLARNLGVR